jgi:hypothetical protein
MMRGVPYVAGVGVVERRRDGGGEEMGTEGTVDSLPEVVNGVRSRISGKRTRTVFFDAYWPKWTDRLMCSARTGGGYAQISATICGD